MNASDTGTIFIVYTLIFIQAYGPSGYFSDSLSKISSRKNEC